MIVSHKHKFIFIKTAKTAGTSIEIALSEFCGDEDIITPISESDEKIRSDLGFRGPQNYRVPLNKYKKIDWAKLFLQGKPAGFYNHMPASEIKALLDRDVWNSYYKFCFDRNPWDKFVSLYYWLNRSDRYSSIEDFMNNGMEQGINGFDLYAIGGIKAVNAVYKYEEMADSLEDISLVLGLPKKLELPKYKAKAGVRKSGGHFSEVLTEEQILMVDLMAAREIKLLGYER
ncbi:sulfotransferase family 2 domain-containing protein [uncultured Alcanivorax sp.]|uniref:sulfotransferase family 2 domain-containing protein n=1 Tax=uncultured Alcanivorax sp. TaxID=191215 RepID=UPI002635D91D|nr:sulfotransferase family 2 domain-containing protein [uncultured Alcanivorax sp.]